MADSLRPTEPVVVLVASRTPLLGDALRHLIETAGDGWSADVIDDPDALLRTGRVAPNVVVFCSSMGGPEMAEALHSTVPGTPLVVMIDGHEGAKEHWPGASATLGLRATRAEILGELRRVLHISW